MGACRGVCAEEMQKGNSGVWGEGVIPLGGGGPGSFSRSLGQQKERLCTAGQVARCTSTSKAGLWSSLAAGVEDSGVKLRRQVGSGL